MNKSYIRLAVFLVLMLALAVGLSYSSLNHVERASADKNDQEDESMSIALVNEDDGATFNQTKLDFGDAFAESIGQNNAHEWYVVSRGVAESGLERNVYDMMIVIPNDFSKKALSINSESPEQVVLSYKINASDSEAVQVQAEETVSSILNKFNREIIDVYFASVLGNLQEAQDNVAEIVEEDAELTYTYNNAIYDPLSGYTNQFGSVQANTERSRKRFSSFEDTLNSYKERLKDRMGFAKDYQTNIAETVELAKAHSVLDLDFLEQLNAYNDALNSEDVKAQLEQLQAMNEYINAQFQVTENDAIAGEKSNIKEVQKYLNASLAEINASEKKFNSKINSVDSDISKYLSGVIGDAIDGKDYLKKMYQEPDQKLRSKIENLISRLPSLDATKIEESGLSPEMTQEIQNVLKVTKKYKFNVDPHHDDNGSIIADHIQTLKDDWKTSGLLMTDMTQLPDKEKLPRKLQITGIPEGFTLTYLTVRIPGMDYKKGSENGELILPKYHQSAEIEVEIRLKLVDESQEFNLGELKEWEWTLGPLDEKETAKVKPDDNTIIQSPVAPLVASTTIEKADKQKQESPDESPKGNKDTNSTKEEKTSNIEGKNKNIENPEGNKQKSDATKQDGSKTNESGVKENPDDTQDEGAVNPGESSESENDSGSGTKPEENDETQDEDDEETETDKVKIVNHHYIYRVTNPVIDPSSEALINAFENTIAPYQKLLSLYELYFGLDLSCESDELDGSPKCGTSLSGSLTDMAGEDSLYALFNKKTGEVLTNYIVQDVMGKVDGSLKLLDQQINDYRTFVKETNENAAELARTIQETKEKATILNKNLQQTLNSITNWRKQSMNLLESQTVIQENNKGMKKAVMTLGDAFKPILSQSQALAERASRNLNKAESVYQTFERIDEQAESIQKSGKTLINRAEVLSANMTDQLLEDQEFVENFSEVMANSQIGGRQNEELYDFLSSPVDAKNKGLIVEGNTFTPYFLVLISFIVALFTAYVLSTARKQHMRDDQFETEQSLMKKNSLITGITAGLGVLEGLVIGLVSAYLLGTDQINLILWTGLMILIMLTMVLVFTYLLRQLKMIGMFIMLIVMSMYLFLTDALTSSLSGMEALRDYSPLHYIDTLLTNAMQGGSDYLFIVLSMIGIALLAMLGNLLVIAAKGKKETEDDENAA